MIKSIGYGLTPFAVMASLLVSPAQAGYFDIVDIDETSSQRATSSGDARLEHNGTPHVKLSPEEEARIKGLVIPPTLTLQPTRYWTDDQFMSYCCAPTWIAFMVAAFLYNHVLN